LKSYRESALRAIEIANKWSSALFGSSCARRRSARSRYGLHRRKLRNGLTVEPVEAHRHFLFHQRYFRDGHSRRDCLGAGFSIFRFVAYIKDELLIVLGTSSSETVLPDMMQKLERLGASRSVVGLVFPTGYVFNTDAPTFT